MYRKSIIIILILISSPCFSQGTDSAIRTIMYNLMLDEDNDATPAATNAITFVATDYTTADETNNATDATKDDETNDSTMLQRMMLRMEHVIEEVNGLIANIANKYR